MPGIEQDHQMGHRRFDLICALALALLPGCMMDGSCPSGGTSLGTFMISYATVDGGDTCVVSQSADGGPTDAGLTMTPSSTALSVCATDGGSQVSLQFSGQTARRVALDGGTFTLADSASNVTGSNCLCALNIAQRVSGRLQIADGGTFAADGDGGYPDVTAIAGNFDELFSAYNGTSGCACNLPCGAHWSMTGTK